MVVRNTAALTPLTIMTSTLWK